MPKHHDTSHRKGLRSGLGAASEKTKRVGNLGRICAALLCASLLLCIPELGYADAVAITSISFSNLGIDASSGTVQFLDVWSSQAFAQGQNSLGEIDQEFNSNTGSNSTITAAVTYAGASGTAVVAPLSGGASSYANIPGAINAEADSTGIGNLSNFFEITGGTGSVDVTFSVLIVSSNSVSTDQFGVLAYSENVFGLEVNGQPELTLDQLLEVGPSSSGSLTFNETLSTTVPLTFGTPYSFVVSEADSESQAIDTTPEPATASLAFIGLAALGAYIRRKRNQTSP